MVSPRLPSFKRRFAHFPANLSSLYSEKKSFLSFFSFLSSFLFFFDNHFPLAPSSSCMKSLDQKSISSLLIDIRDIISIKWDMAFQTFFSLTLLQIREIFCYFAKCVCEQDLLSLLFTLFVARKNIFGSERKKRFFLLPLFTISQSIFFFTFKNRLSINIVTLN